jgi:hypothetical protein
MGSRGSRSKMLERDGVAQWQLQCTTLQTLSKYRNVSPSSLLHCGREKAAVRSRRAYRMHVHETGIRVAGGELKWPLGGTLRLGLGTLAPIGQGGGSRSSHCGFN